MRRHAEVPAMLYAVQKQLLYHSISNLEPAVYQAPRRAVGWPVRTPLVVSSFLMYRRQLRNGV